MIWPIAIGWVIYLKYIIKDQIIVSWCSYEVPSCNNLLAAYIAYMHIYVQHPSSASLSFFSSITCPRGHMGMWEDDFTKWHWIYLQIHFTTNILQKQNTAEFHNPHWIPHRSVAYVWWPLLSLLNGFHPEADHVELSLLWAIPTPTGAAPHAHSNPWHKPGLCCWCQLHCGHGAGWSVSPSQVPRPSC